MKPSFGLFSRPVRFRQIAWSLLFLTISCAVFAGRAQSQAPLNSDQSNRQTAAQSNLPCPRSVPGTASPSGPWHAAQFARNSRWPSCTSPGL